MAAVGVSVLLVIQVTWSDRQSSRASKGECLSKSEPHPVVQGCVASPYHLMQILLLKHRWSFSRHLIVCSCLACLEAYKKGR